MELSCTQRRILLNSLFWSRLGFSYDPPLLDENGKQVLFSDDLERFARYHYDFLKAGVKIHTSILPSGWIGIDRYDYELTDKTLDALFETNRDLWYIPRVKLNVPRDWGYAYPEELFVYFEGPHDREEIRSLVGTLRHDFLGYEAPYGYYMGKDNRPNVGGLISNQSFASQKWLQDAGEALRRLIENIKGGPYADRIIGYHIAYGTSGETVLWGTISGRFGDYGIAARQAFFQWGMEKYQSLERLREAWRQPKLEKDNIQLPHPDLRENRTDSLKSVFRANPEDQILIDYERFMSDVNVNAIEHFGRIVKDETKGQALVGSFYGYFLEVDRSGYTGHLELDKILNSPYVDFLAAPISYYRRNVGEPGGEIGPAQSINRKKLWFDEIDIRTSICENDAKNAETLEETKTILWREFAKNTAHGSGLWWMDLGGGWYDSVEIMKEIKLIEQTRRHLQKKPGKSVSEILLVVDEESFYHISPNHTTHNLFMKEFVREANLCGAPVDMYRFRDLKELDLAQYKIIFFVNTFFINHDEWLQTENKIPSGTTLVWFYAPGIKNPDFGLKNVSKITGFEVQERGFKNLKPVIDMNKAIVGDCSTLVYDGEQPLELPLLEVIQKDGIQVLGQYNDGGIASATRYSNHKHIYFALPLLSSEHIRLLAKDAGCHFYAPSNCTVYADNRFIGVFPRVAINSELFFQKPTTVTNMVNKESWEQIISIPLVMDAKTVAFFVLQEQNEDDLC